LIDPKGDLSGQGAGKRKKRKVRPKPHSARPCWPCPVDRKGKGERGKGKKGKGAIKNEGKSEK
jgi:hypothetical protein